jgi:hypothetical protein
MKTSQRARLGLTVIVLLVIVALLALRNGSPCDRLARDLDNASAVAATYQPGTEIFAYAASKAAGIRAEMQAQGCSVR